MPILGEEAYDDRTRMKLRWSVVALVAIVVSARRGVAQAAADAADPVGVWRGTSLCLVRPSACKDEVVVYRITRVRASDTLSVDARKIVSGQEEEMGVLACRAAPLSASFTCAMPNGVWRFTVRRDSLVGELRLPDSTKFRDVRAARAPSQRRPHAPGQTRVRALDRGEPETA